ncbi:tRNA pseudouridine(13) synthase TruD [Aliagarivorans marinus]|uniref:tRNA pseudouridine(13) synthase TruD n=1 Tax=Aliagarivorans marinus TaxID=561965 RepID=UPI0003FA4032|nr:tRNA pseudouridine(13) synthase TruD [Aliagarivorans marinus]
MTEPRITTEQTALPEFAYLYGKPKASASLKQQVEDFRVDELLPFEFSGDGEHMLLHIEKRDANTQWVAKQIARALEIAPRDVSYAGLKDRHGVTAQWFSAQLPGKANPELPEELAEGVKILATARHNKKLKRGALSGNNFTIRLRDVSDVADVEARLAKVAQSGVPNYFGNQRFGFNGGNIVQARAMFDGKRIRDRDKRSMYLSAARSLVFNAIISERVSQDCFASPLPGEVFKFRSSNAIFSEPELSDALLARFNDQEIELTALMAGSGELASQSEVAAIEQAVIERHQDLVGGLAKAGLKMERRALALYPQNLTWQWQEQDLVVSFFLPAGCFATSVLRELAICEESR